MAASFALALACCKGAGDVDNAPRTAVRDSAGVTVVQLPDGLAGVAIPEIVIDRSFRVGDSGSGTELYRVSGARFLSTGELVVASGGAPELLLLSHRGKLIRRMGEAGEGPGQFSTITSVHLGESGTIVTYDDPQGRLTEFAPDGTVTGTRRMLYPSPVSDLLPLNASMSGPTLAVYKDNRHFGTKSTLRRDTTPLFRYSADSMDADTVSLWPTKVWSFGEVAMGTTRTQPPFSPDLLSAGGSDRVALADTHAPLVSILDETGRLVMSVRWTDTPRPVTERDIEEWAQRRNEELPEDLPKGVREQLMSVSHAGTHAVLNRLALDAERNLWIAPETLRTPRKQTWLIIDNAGALVGGVSLPVSALILDARDGHIAVLDKDELDVERVTVFSFSTTPGTRVEAGS